MFPLVRIREWIISLPLFLAIAAACEAQAPAANDFLSQYASTYHFSLGQPTAFQVSDEGDVVLYLRSGPRSFVRNLYEFEVATGKERLLAAADDLLKGEAEQLSMEELARRERSRSAARGIASFELSRDGQQVLVPLSGSLYVIDRKSGKSRELKSERGFPIDARFSPDGKSIAAVRNGDLYVTDVASGAERRLTSGANETLSHGQAEFVAQEEMHRMHGYWWSGDSQQIAYQETNTAPVEALHIADPTNPNKPAHAWRYPRPGHNNAAVRLGVIAAAGGDTTWVKWDREKYPYLATVRWEKDSPLAILVQNREQTDELLLAINPTTGDSTELLKETDAAWVNIDSTMPYWLDDGTQFLWSTERRGAWQLELRNRDGHLAKTLTPPEICYRALAGVDERRGIAYFVGGDDPTQSQLFSVSLQAAGTRPQQITTVRGLHSAVFVKHGGVHVVSEQTLEGDIHQRVYGGDQTLVGEIPNLAEKPPFAANLELTVVSQDPPLRAAIIRPRNFDRNRRYPVIVHVYGGPHGQTVHRQWPKLFARTMAR